MKLTIALFALAAFAQEAAAPAKLDTSSYWRAVAYAQSAHREADAADRRAEAELRRLQDSCVAGTRLVRPDATPQDAQPDFQCTPIPAKK